MNLNHIEQKHPVGVMFAYLVGTERQTEGMDVFKVPVGQYMCIPLGDNSIAAAIGAEPWYGGMAWISENIASRFGYVCVGDALPVFEYYVFENGKRRTWMYVPVEKSLSRLEKAENSCGFLPFYHLMLFPNSYKYLSGESQYSLCESS